MAFVYLLGDSGQDNTYKIGVTRGKIEKLYSNNYKLVMK